ncbi:tetratricopeptide repeat protein, partial [bacterium]|nr:tetratricopeptide repeat protein [bacterium]
MWILDLINKIIEKTKEYLKTTKEKSELIKMLNLIKKKIEKNILQKFPKGSTGIILSELKRSEGIIEPSYQDVLTKISEELLKRVEKAGLKEVQLRKVKVLENNEEAKKSSRKHQATLVLRSEISKKEERIYLKTHYNFNFTVYEYQKKVEEGDFKVGQIQEIILEERYDGHIDQVVNILMGLSYYLNCKWSEAEKELAVYLSRAYEILRKEDLRYLHLLMGNIYYFQGKYNLANLEYNNAIKVSPYFSLAYQNLGSSYAINKEYFEAISSYKESIIIGFDEVIVYYNLALAYLKIDNLEEAIIKFRKVIEIQDDYEDVYYKLGCVYLKCQRNEEAIFCFQKALEDQEDNEEIYYQIGVAYLENKRLEEAISALQRTISLKEDHLEAHFKLGVAYLENKRLEE